MSAPPPSVLFVGPHPQKPGGVATFCRAVFAELRFPAQYFARGTRLHSAAAAARAAVAARDYASFRRRVRRPGVGAVHLNLSLSRVSVLRDRGFVGAARQAGRALVLGIHGWNQAFFDAARQRRFGALRRVLAAADVIFVVNRDAQRSLREAGYGDVVEVVPSVLEAALVEGVRFDGLAAARRGPPVLLFLARLEPAKGVLAAVEAFERVQKHRPDARLIVAGAGSAATAVAELVRHRGIANVELPGHLTGEAKIAALRRATVYLLPSTHDEGMPHSLIEAMAFGLPAITAPAAGVRDFFVDGEMGFTSHTGSAEDLARLVLEILDDTALRERIGRRNFAFARAEFSAAAVAARFDQTYRRLVG